MRTIFIAAAAVVGLSGVAFAGEAEKTVVMTDDQMDQIVAGGFVIIGGRNGVDAPPLSSPPPGLAGNTLPAATPASCLPGVKALEVNGTGNAAAC